MGVAASQRGDQVIRQSLWSAIDSKRGIKDEFLALQVAEDCNEFVRQVMAYLVEPKGMRQPSVERAKTRKGWAKRHTDLVCAHNAWVDVNSRHAYSYHSACVKRAQAAYQLITFALGTWTIPSHIDVPRAAIAR